MSNCIAYSMQYITCIIIEMENNCCVHIHVNDCDLMETQKIEEAWLVLYITFWSKWPNSCSNRPSYNLSDNGTSCLGSRGIPIPSWKFWNAMAQMKMIYQEVFLKTKVTNQSKIYTHPVIKFTVSEFDRYQFFSSLTYYT